MTMKNMIKENGMLPRIILAACAATLLLACGATITIPYSTGTAPTIWIQYPTECTTESVSATNSDQVCAADSAICLSAATQEFPVFFAVFNAPAGSVVQVRLDRHI